MKRFWRIEHAAKLQRVGAGSWWSDDWRPHESRGLRLGYNTAHVKRVPYGTGWTLRRRSGR